MIRPVATLSAVIAMALCADPVGAQSPMTHDPATMSHHDGTHQHGTMGMEPEAMPPARPTAMPRLPGQDAFGAIQEIIALLEADPATDWTSVDIEGLRRHLVDMNELTLNAQSQAEEVPGGARFTVTGTGRTLEAIQRMVPAHAAFIDGMKGWSLTAEPTAEGAVLTVTAEAPEEVAHIRGLGFIGVMATGAHHQEHHMAMARGDAPHGH